MSDDVEKDQLEDLEDDAPAQNVFIIDTGNKGPKFRAVSLFGALGEEELTDVVHGLVALQEACLEENARNEETEEPPRTIKFYISTWGGDMLGMFAIYDLMRLVRDECEIETIGLGKVMSAGVLLLAAGTKGKRQIGKNARLMFHSVQSGQYGPLYSLEKEMEEARWLQERTIQCLIDESKLTKRKIQKMLDQKVDFYIGAEEAVALGIADIII